MFTIQSGLAFILGVISALGFLASPLKAPLTHALYGTELSLQLLTSKEADPDQGSYQPELLLSSESLGGIPNGTVLWNVISSSSDLNYEVENKSVDFPSFIGSKTLAGPKIRVFENEGDIKINAEVRLSGASKPSTTEVYEFSFRRDSGRNYVVRDNFTGIWKVEFLEAGSIGELEVKVNADGEANGWLRVKDTILGFFSGEVAMSGSIDGSTFNLAADLAGIGKIGFKDVVVIHSKSDSYYSLPGEIGIYDANFEPLDGYVPEKIVLNVARNPTNN